jgi:predicted 3-demethylubiquinone-9 3-methyltransferase (glyoxalase superfamily)
MTRNPEATMTAVTTFLWFAEGAEDAVRFYTGLVPGSEMGEKMVLAAETPGGPAGSVYTLTFTLAGQRFGAINAGPLDPFNHAVSIMVACEDQAELDRVWDGLLEGGRAERCGWLRDRYGVSWQVVPRGMEAMMKSPDKARAKRVGEAMMQMVKFDIAKLRAAYDGEAG